MSAWTILIIGISTVFLCLFAIIGLVVVLKALLSKRPARMGKAVSEPKNDAGELVAVISAAVAAMLNTQVNAIRIASIEKSGMISPAWALAERYSRQPQGTVPRCGK